MTEEELQRQWQYDLDERLGILCGDGPITPEALEIATSEANEHREQLRNFTD